MNDRTRRPKLILVALAICTTLWGASQWWEKAWAKPAHAADISPNGCYRVQQFRPYWVLPSFFHPKPHPDEMMETHWFVGWESPAFFRLYNNHTGEFISESGIYDLVNFGGNLYWGRSVSVGMIEVGSNLPDCMGGK
ncbi:hypothetical protein [Pseudomonas sp. TWP3-1]|uniref:hypothetical protein n=1 Tax=Pseudomonas sp. TWP3-1 TaxID=2804631 RepID=UPI003CF9107B